MLRAFILRALPLSAPLLAGGCCPSGSTLTETLKIPGGFPDGGLTDAGCEEICRAYLAPGRAAEPLVSCSHDDLGNALCVVPGCIGGRAPRGFSPERGADLVGYLSSAYQLERASVIAFRLLAAELLEHRAPRSLVARARRFARDERRHARAMRALVRRHGVTPSMPEIAGRKSRPLCELAIENAVEGCVRETWGALITTLQAQRATNPGIRAIMTRIAPDEVRHADLAWVVNDWALRRLSGKERLAMKAAQRQAAEALAAHAIDVLPAASRDPLGLRGPAEAHALAHEALRTLWA